MTELTNTMTKQELIATQNVNNMENGSLVSRVEQNEQDISTLQPCIMTVSANNKNIVLSKSGIINLNYVLNSTGTKLTQGNNGITIGAGVTKVKVSCNFWVNAEAQRRVWIKLCHWSVGSGKAIGEVISTDMSGFVTGSISPVLVDASQGDYFYLYYDNEVTGMSINKSSGNYHATTLTVEVVE